MRMNENQHEEGRGMKGRKMGEGWRRRWRLDREAEGGREREDREGRWREMMRLEKK